MNGEQLKTEERSDGLENIIDVAKRMLERWNKEAEKCQSFNKLKENDISRCSNCTNAKRGYICEDGLAVKGCYICKILKKEVGAFSEQTKKYNSNKNITIKYASGSEEWSMN